jgi:hypothetical protein
MKPARRFAHVQRRFYRPEVSRCGDKRLRRAVTLSERTVITLEGVIKLVHAGYRCPDPICVGHQRTYRSVQADALALPWFTYGLDVVLLVGQLRLSEHQTVDEIHQELLKRLEPYGVKIARREILYLFEAYCTLLRASSEAKDDQLWFAQVEHNGGIIVSVDGIQPEKGNETVYLVRDALTGRVLAAENVTSSETAVMKALLAPIRSLGVKVLGTISDAQESELLALQELWPEVPHQVCQFHALRDASKHAFETDKQVKTAMRKQLQPKVREVRTQIKKRLDTAEPPEAAQLVVLDDYASGIITALNTDGLQPFVYATVESTAMLDDIARELAATRQKRGPVSWACAQKLARLQAIVAERRIWSEQLAQIRCLHEWLREIEHILDGSQVQAAGEGICNETVGRHLDAWREHMRDHLTNGTLTAQQSEIITEFLQVLAHLLASLPGAVLRSARVSSHQ